MKTLGKAIRSLRQQKSWSQEDVSTLLGISIPAFSKIETGVTDINLSRLEQIAAVFGLSTVQLLTYDQAGQAVTDSKLEDLNKKLNTREIEVIDLQKKVISLFEELRHTRETA